MRMRPCILGWPYLHGVHLSLEDWGSSILRIGERKRGASRSQRFHVQISMGTGFCLLRCALVRVFPNQSRTGTTSTGTTSTGTTSTGTTSAGRTGTGPARTDAARSGSTAGAIDLSAACGWKRGCGTGRFAKPERGAGSGPHGPRCAMTRTATRSTVIPMRRVANRRRCG